MPNQEPPDKSSIKEGLYALLVLAGYFFLGSIFLKVGYGPGTFVFWSSFVTLLILQAIAYTFGARSDKR